MLECSIMALTNMNCRDSAFFYVYEAPIYSGLRSESMCGPRPHYGI